MATLERAEGSGSSEEAAGQEDWPRCGICSDLACEPLMADRCCEQVFCSKCLKEYLEDIQGNHNMPCPLCKKEHFTYMQLTLKVHIMVV